MLNQVILLVGTIYTSTSVLKTSSGNLVKSILTKRSIRVHYMISTSSEIWNSLQPKLAMFLCSRAVLFKKKVVNQLSFYRNSSNMFITKTSKYKCLGVLNVSFHPAYRILSFMYFFFKEQIESILKYWYYVIF